MLEKLLVSICRGPKFWVKRYRLRPVPSNKAFGNTNPSSNNEGHSDFASVAFLKSFLFTFKDFNKENPLSEDFGSAFQKPGSSNAHSSTYMPGDWVGAQNCKVNFGCQFGDQNGLIKIDHTHVWALRGGTAKWNWCISAGEWDGEMTLIFASKISKRSPNTHTGAQIKMEPKWRGKPRKQWKIMIISNVAQETFTPRHVLQVWMGKEFFFFFFFFVWCLLWSPWNFNGSQSSGHSERKISVFLLWSPSDLRSENGAQMKMEPKWRGKHGKQ